PSSRLDNAGPTSRCKLSDTDPAHPHGSPSEHHGSITVDPCRGNELHCCYDERGHRPHSALSVSLCSYLEKTIRSAVEQHLFDAHMHPDQGPQPSTEAAAPAPSPATTARQRRRQQREQDENRERC
ncbi:protein FAM13A isoform X2, partial [Clarias magur]